MFKLHLVSVTFMMSSLVQVSIVKTSSVLFWSAKILVYPRTLAQHKLLTLYNDTCTKTALLELQCVIVVCSLRGQVRW